MIDLDNVEHDVVLYREKCDKYFILDEYCEIEGHEKFIYNRWCDKCNEAFCDKCWEDKNIGGKHKFHEVEPLQPVYERYRADYKKKLAFLRAEVLPYNRAILAGIEPDVEGCEAVIQELEEKMRRKVDKLKKAVDKIINDYCPKKLRRMENKMISQLNTQCKDLENHIEYLRDVVDKYERSANKPAEFLFFLKEHPLNDIPDLPKSCEELPDLRFDGNVTKSDVLRLLGEIKTQEVGVRKAENEYLLEVLDKIKSLATVNYGEKKSARHISAVTPDEFWVSFKDKLVYLDKSGKEHHKITDHLDCDSGVHDVNEDDELFYIDKKLNVKKFSKDGTTSETVIKREGDWEPISMACCYNGNILVAMMIHVVGEAKVVCYNRGGGENLSIQLDNNRKPLYQTPRFVCENRNDDVVVSNHYENRGTVVVTDSKGNYRFTFKGNPKEPGFKPGGIVFDGLSNILVCDENSNTVLLLDKDGNFKKSILTQHDGIGRPRCVGYCHKNHSLFVGSAVTTNVLVFRHINRQSKLGGINYTH